MTFSKWLYQVEVFERAMDDVNKQRDSIRKEYDDFFEKTVGFKPGDLAGLTGTVVMMGKVFDMKKAEEEKEE